MEDITGASVEVRHCSIAGSNVRLIMTNLAGRNHPIIGCIYRVTNPGGHPLCNIGRANDDKDRRSSSTPPSSPFMARCTVFEEIIDK